MTETKYLDLQGLTYYDSKIKSLINTKDEEIKVVAEDSTLTITPGSTDTKGTTNTKIKVNIDGTTIKTNEAGKLSVASEALTEYVGDDKTISISSAVNNQKTISSTIKIKKVTEGLDANVEEAWDLVDANDGAITGSNRIIIKKDNSFVNGQLGHTDDTINENTGEITTGTGNAAIDLIYKNNEGKYILITIDIEEYLKEAEFKDGFDVNGHDVKVKLSTNTESAKYLKIQAIDGENGAIELSGIDAAIKAASASITDKTSGHVKVSGTISENGTIYTITEEDIASAQDLSDEVTYRKAVTGIQADSYAADSNTNYIKNASSLHDADKKLDAQIKATAEEIAAFTPITYEGEGNDIDKLF